MEPVATRRPLVRRDSSRDHVPAAGHDVLHAFRGLEVEEKEEAGPAVLLQLEHQHVGAAGSRRASITVWSGGCW
jgi:hypothetical protein